jgi:hypothetical protein
MAELLYSGGVAFGLALLIGFLAGTTPRRTVAVVAVTWGLLAAPVVVLAAFGADDACRDYCGNRFWFFLATVNGLAWLVGAVAGGAIRRAVRAAQR